jgi:plastocyanin
MKKSTFPIAAGRLIVMFSALLFIGTLAPLTSSMAAGKTVVIEMTDTSAGFVPKRVTIRVGDTLEWRNGGASLHSVDADPANAQKPTDVVLPKGAPPFDSGFLAPGATYSHTFTVPGQYRYVCLSHEKEQMKMFGYVTVKK